MADFTLPVAAKFPEGTTVSLYLREDQAAGSNSPLGSAIDSDVVTNGSVTFTGLTEDVAYVAFGQVDGAWKRKGFKVNEIPDPVYVKGTQVATTNDLATEVAALEAADDALGTRIDNIVTEDTDLSPYALVTDLDALSDDVDDVAADLATETSDREAGDIYIGRWVEQLQDYGKGFAYHDDDSTVDRPAGFASVEWVGTAEPDNAELNDTWVDQSTQSLKIRSDAPEQVVVTGAPSTTHGSPALTNPTNAYALDGIYATCSATSSRKQAIYGNFGFDSSIPVGATIDQVEAIYTYFVASGATSPRAELNYVKDGATSTLHDWVEDTSEPTTLAAVTVDITGGGFTRSELLNDTFRVYLAGRDPAGTTAMSFDSLIVRVTYTTPSADTTLILKEDDCSVDNFTTLWGPASANGTYGDAYGSSMASTDRVSTVGSGGDTFTKLDGTASSQKYRAITVSDGDASVIGSERAEMGHNAQSNSFTTNPAWTFYRFREGETFRIGYSLRNPTVGGLDASTSLFQLVSQFKQTGSAVNSGGTPVISHHLRGNEWRIYQSDSPGASENSSELWACPYVSNTWTRFIWDITFSQDDTIGALRLQVDDGTNQYDSDDDLGAGFNTYTLKYETTNGTYPNGGPNQTAGQSIPSHLRLGPYHDPSLAGGTLHVANVQIATVTEGGSWVTLLGG